jgi:hypothetical protein
MVRRTLYILALGLATAAARAQTIPPPVNPPPPPERTLFTRINGLFTGDLPQLDPPGTFKLILRPHFGDLVRRDYMRVDTGLRWALNDRFELSAEASVYFDHGFGGSSSSGSGSAGYGIGRLRFGSKYVFERWPWPNYETSLGLNTELPTGHPPIDMTDGHYHVSPTIVIQHNWYSVPRLSTFSGAGLDFLKSSSVAGTFGTNQPHDSSLSLTAGGIYDMGQVKWTFATTYATTALVSGNSAHFVYVQPGLLWYVPSRFTFHSKTQWIVGFAASTSIGPDGTDFSLSSRLRAEITFRQVMDKLHWPSSAHRAP